MSDQRSVMKEYRSLDEKRLAEGLTPDEEARFARLHDLVGPEMGAGRIRAGFDVNAAAAQLRDSLVPAGLRNRPPPAPAPAPAAEPEPEPEPDAADLSAADALASLYAEEPFAAIDEATTFAQPEALFDPSSLGTEPAPQDPNAYAEGTYDPNAYDPNAQAGWDPNQPWDPNAALEAQPEDPNAAYTADPNAAYAPYDPNAVAPENAAYDPGAQPAWDPNEPWNPNGAPAAQQDDPYAAYAADPNAAYAPYDPNAPAPDGAAYDPNAPVPDGNAYDPNQPWDPNAALEAQPEDPNAAYSADPNAAYAADPNAPSAAGGTLDPSESPAAAAFGAAPQAGDDSTLPWDASAVQDAQPFDPIAFPEADSSFPGSAAEAPLAALGAFHEEGSGLAPAGWDAEPPLPEATPGTPLGEYDETGGGLAVAEDAGLAGELAFDADGSTAAEVGEPPILGEYDDTAGFGATAYAAPASEAEPPGFEVAAAPEPESPAGWPADAALEDDGFQLESGGSFGAGADAAAPEWARPAAAPPWENAPLLDLGAPPEPPVAGDADGYAVPDAGETFAAPAEDGRGLFAGGEVALSSARDDLALPQAADLATDLEGIPADGPAPELDFSHPDFSAEEAAFVEGAEQGATPLEAPPSEAAFGEPLEPEEPGTDAFGAPAAAPPLDLGFGAPEEVAAPEIGEGLAFDVSEEAAPVEEDIPTIDAADILEEITDDPGAGPPLPLDFEPLVPVTPEAILAPPPPAPPPVAASAPPELVAQAAPACHVAGSHRVVVHTVEGQVKRGVLDDADLDAAELAFTSQPGTAPEVVPTEKVKAIFFMLAPGELAPAPEGKKVRVTFRDGRQVAGFSPAYDDTGVGFFMIPGDTRTNTGRIWVYRSAVRQVAVS